MSGNTYKIIFTLFCLTLIGFFSFTAGPSPAWGLELKDMATKDKGAPVNITADNLEADNKAHQIVFTGNVVAKREDALLYADKMIVYLTEKMDNMKEIHAVGNVRVTQKDRFASGDKGIYYDAEQKVVLTGNPKVWQGENVITGEIIEFYIKEEKAKALRGENKRVTATIIPGKGMSLPGGGSSEKPAKKEDKNATKQEKAAKPPGEKSAKKQDKAGVEEININKASKEELSTKFPGLEENKIDAILKGRPYKALIDLVKKGILNQKEWELVRDYATVK